MPYLTTCNAFAIFCSVAIFVTAQDRAGQAIAILSFGFRTGMCAYAFFGWEPAPFFDPFTSVPFQGEARTGATKKKTRHTRVLSYPPSTSSDLPKDLLLVNALIATCLLLIVFIIVKHSKADGGGRTRHQTQSWAFFSFFFYFIRPREAWTLMRHFRRKKSLMQERPWTC